jgi:hypothetical protein
VVEIVSILLKWISSGVAMFPLADIHLMLLSTFCPAASGMEPKSQGCPDAPPGSPAHATATHHVSYLSLCKQSFFSCTQFTPAFFLPLAYRASGVSIVRR